MKLKTQVSAAEGKQEVLITRVFDLPLAALFKAYVEPEIVAQWMGTKVLKLESRKHGSYQLETTDTKGNVHGFTGVIHEFSLNRKITRTFEIENAPFGVQLEFYEFEQLTDNTSKLSMRVLYESVAQRDQVVKMGMAPGINLAHNSLQDIVGNLLT